MSRIHEALKRAASSAASDLRIVPGAPAFPLDHYPQEMPASTEAACGPEPSVPTELSSPGPRDARPAGAVRPLAPAGASRVAIAPPPSAVQYVPRVASGTRRRGKVLGADAPEHAVAEYGRLAIALRELQSRSSWIGPDGTDRGLKTVSITSAVPGEGKTLTAVNLALSLSESDAQRVVLIDGNVRHASVHQVLGLRNEEGLTDFLRSDEQRLALQEVSPALSVLTVGRPVVGGVAALESERMRTLLAELSLRFDWVLLDSPSAALLPDARLLARLTRAVLLVIGGGSTGRATVDRAVARLGRDCVIGAVLNQTTD